MNRYDNSAALILSHGRPDSVKTYGLLQRSGWTRPTYIVVDDEDKTLNQYRSKYGTDSVIVFSKEQIAQTTDVGDSQPERNTVLFARNACWEIARNLGIEYFIELDDDYGTFQYRYILNDSLRHVMIRQFDQVFDALAEFLDTSGATSVAMSQGGDMIGGLNNNWRKQMLRKAMNSFVCRTDRPFNFLGRMNDDVNTYVVHGSRGHKFFTFMPTQLVQTPTQQQDGGLTDMYKKYGTYVKSFYTVMMAPSSVDLMSMGTSYERIHHRIHWDNTVPKIISDRYRKVE